MNNSLYCHSNFNSPFVMSNQILGSKMKRLKHTGSICEYVKEFSTLVLEIPNMFEKEQLFNFMDNQQSQV